ncbi:GNAT family N-acetyltransferase [Micromonospora kangleipakensis]|uniref:GNAT family N-acetyltransferase n=1 Tax=Micromonospora kangleipakensis TaxID=1077942 RepID=UPI00102A4828|nr:GNAT family N-acetyltransferase [Micromonospora kangleipakensis]
MTEINSKRLVLRDWRESDLAPWAAMNADPLVREHLGPLLDLEQATASVRHFQQDIDRKGYGFWAVEVRDTGEFIGFTGLDDVDDGVRRLGMTTDPGEDFDDPEEEGPLRRQTLWRLRRPDPR